MDPFDFPESWCKPIIAAMDIAGSAGYHKKSSC
jgi:hypothetical protein